MQNFGEVDTLITHKRHKIVKLTYPKSRIECLKIFAFPAKEKYKLDIYRDHFENVREWLRLRYSSRSFLKMLDKLEPKIETRQIETQSATFLKVTTQYSKFPNLDIYYRRVELNREKESKIPLSSIMYYIVEFFEVIMRGGSITNFFYTPNNLFICRPPPLQENREIGRFSINILSTVGLQLLLLSESIIKEDLEEIFPLLPLNLRELLEEKDFIQINRIIKMKALAWNILSFIVGYVPNVLIRQTLETTVTASKVFGLLMESREGPQTVMNELLEISRQDIQKAQTQTGIHFQDFFKITLVQNCKNITWSDIYSRIFQQNREAKNKQIESKSKHPQNSSTASQSNKPSRANLSSMILKALWNEEERRSTDSFYKQRSIPEASTVYFLVKTNIRFRSMMNHFNILEFIFETKQSREAFKAQLAFVGTNIQKIPGLDKHFVSPIKQQRKNIPEPYNITPEGRMYVPFSSLQMMRSISDRHPDHYCAEMLSEIQDSSFFEDY